MRAPSPFHRKAATRQLLLLGSLIPLFLVAAESPTAHVRNFGKVNDHLYRGGEPSLVALQELGAMGVKVVIDLREASDSTNFERPQVEKLGMTYVNLPMRPFSTPTQEQMEHALSLLVHDDSKPIFVHCRRGKDRTGTVIACYRVQHDGWTNRQAFGEAKKYGISVAERGMRSYILHFSPAAISSPAKARVSEY